MQPMSPEIEPSVPSGPAIGTVAGGLDRGNADPRVATAIATELELEHADTLDVRYISHELRSIIGRLVRRIRGEHRFGITHTAVLGRLYRDGPHCIGELATLERVRPQSMSQTLAELEGEGLIQRGPDAKDGRRTRIALTTLGSSVVEADRASDEGWLAAQIAGLTPEEQEILRAALPLLDRLTHSA